MNRRPSIAIAGAIGGVVVLVCAAVIMVIALNLNPAPATLTAVPNTTSSPFADARVGAWRIFPTSIESISESQGRKPREGYKFIQVGLALENSGSNLEMLSDVNRSVGFDLQIQTAGGFTYSGNVEMGAWSNVYLPPKYSVPMNALFEIPANATGVKLLARTWQGQQGRNSGTPITWNLDNEFKSDLSHIPADMSGLKKLGDATEQINVISVTPLKAGLWRYCGSSESWWELYLQVQMRNNFGYDVSIRNVMFQILDEDGAFLLGSNQLYSDVQYPDWSSLKPSGLFNLAPGLTKTGIVGGRVSKSDSANSQNWRCPETTIWSPKPRAIRVLVVLPAITQPQQVKQVWAVYDVGEPTDNGHGSSIQPTVPPMATIAPAATSAPSR